MIIILIEDVDCFLSFNFDIYKYFDRKTFTGVIISLHFYCFSSDFLSDLSLSDVSSFWIDEFSKPSSGREKSPGKAPRG